MDLFSSLEKNKNKCLNYLSKLLKADDRDICVETLKLLKSGNINSELDISLRELYSIKEYKYISCVLRYHLGFTIRTEKEFLKNLEKLKEHIELSNDLDCDEKKYQLEIIEMTKRYVKEEDYDPENFYPSIELNELIDGLNVEQILIVLRCIDYINMIYE